MNRVAWCLLLGLIVLINNREATAQGLIWSLPDEVGASIQFDGTYTQTNKQSDPDEPDIQIQWLRQITVKYVEAGMAMYQAPNTAAAESVPAKWIEIKVVTGKAAEGGGIDPGPAGQRIFKVLVPEPAFVGAPRDADGIPISFIPIAEGSVKIGNGEPQPIEGKVLRVFPMISLLRHFDTYEPALDSPEDPVDPEVDAQVPGLMAHHHRANLITEDEMNRWTEEAEIWFSDQVPFGVVRWSVRMTGEKKLASQPRTEFQESTEIVVEMKAKEIRNDAKSELNAP